MLTLGSLGFAAPWLLTALLLLPAIWFLLRVTPPAPRRQSFPAIALLRNLMRREETPARTPWWLLLLRLVLAALVILALAQPLLNPSAGLPGRGPVLAVVDTGWAANHDWEARRRALTQLAAQAAREGRPLHLLATAPPAAGGEIAVSGPLAGADARGAIQSLRPHPWPVDREAARTALAAFTAPGALHVEYFSDGLDAPGTEAFLQDLARRGGGGLRVPEALPHLLRPPRIDGRVLVAPVERAVPIPDRATEVEVRATAEDGRLLDRSLAQFEPGARTAEARFDLPMEIRNEVTRFTVAEPPTVGANVLIDERWRRRPVGVVSGRGRGDVQPLLSDVLYIEKALETSSEVRRGTAEELIRRGISVLVLSDVGALTPSEVEQIGTWVEAGGVLLRFAGPRLAERAGESDPLLPVRLRRGDRALGGALSWEEPARLAGFSPSGPLAKVDLLPDVQVRRQVLAEPTTDLPTRTWAVLEDGTPLVTGAARGAGWLVLVHTTANPDWSTLSFSGVMVQMLREIVSLSVGVAETATEGALAPVLLFDGRAQLGPPSALAVPVPAAAFESVAIGPRHPPGFYGTDLARRALDLSARVREYAPLPQAAPGLVRSAYRDAQEVSLMPWLLTAAVLLALIDLMIALGLRGLLPQPRPRALKPAATALGLLPLALTLLLLVPDRPAAAQSPPPAPGAPGLVIPDPSFAERAANETWLAYVRTGDGVVDATSQAGLEGLALILRSRTSVEAAGAMAVDLEANELAFFPLLYWPITDAQPALSDGAVARLNEYLRNGGLIVFDTRDAAYGAAAEAAGAPTPGAGRLAQLARRLDLPPVGPVPPDHVLTKAFYLFEQQDFPGRVAGGQVWIESGDGEARRDNVSAVIVGGNDWAGAWAADAYGRPMFPVSPGGERQREMAYRFGVNLVMYALTGNYKSDQVHVPFILERLGQ